MTYSNLTDTRTNTPQKSSRQGARVDHILLHHMAGTDAAGVVALMQSGKRQVSANYAIGRDGHAWGVVPEEERAWTSGSATDGGRGAAWDRRSITFEIADEVAGDAHGWPISAASFEKVARMIADIATRYGIPIDREHIIGHRELWERYKASYPTACPGGLDLDAITARARVIQSGGGSAPEPTKPLEVPPMSASVVLAAVPSNVWYSASPGHFDGIPSGQGDLHLKMAGQTGPAVISDKEVAAARDYFLHMNPTQVYAVADGALKDQWFVVGPGVYFPVPAGKGGDYEALYGSRHVVSGEQFATIRNANRAG